MTARLGSEMAASAVTASVPVATRGDAAPCARCLRQDRKTRSVREAGTAPRRIAATADAPANIAAAKARRTKKRVAVVAVVAVLALIAAFACWRYLPGAVAWLLDASAVRGFVAEHAVASRFALLGINMAQIVLAFLPGEPVELASGYAFGFWEGTALCLAASAVATSAIFFGVRRFGWRLVGVFFDRAQLESFSWLQHTKRLELVMLIIFLIPGTPKDFLTYFAGLTRMRFAPVVLIATFGRIPSIVTSTMAASAFGNGDYAVAAIVVAVAVAMAAIGALAYRRVMRNR